MKCETCGQPLVEKPSTLHQTYGSIPAVLFECAVAENFDGHSHYRRWVRKDGASAGAGPGTPELRSAE